MINAIPPSWKITVGYCPVWTVQKEDEMAGGATEAHRQFVGNEFRFVINEDRSVRTAYAKPIERVFLTNLTNKEDAEDLLSRLVRIYGRERKVYRGVGYEAAFRVRVGDRINLEYDRYGIGGEMLVVSVGEDAKTGRTEMELWA